MTSIDAPQTQGLVVPQDAHFDQALALDCGRALDGFSLRYETYGELNAARSNAVLICHALSGDHHAAGYHDDDTKPGWWDVCIGPGKPIDTRRFFVVCPNNLGGCRGSTGPLSTNPATGEPYGPEFPIVTVHDWMKAQAALADRLGIESWAAVIGGSLGGMNAMQWAIELPERVRHCVMVAVAPRLSAQNIAFNEVARQAIRSDPDFHDGYYYRHGVVPRRGLMLARMLGHITYLSDDSMRLKFGRELRDGKLTFDFDVNFEVESYLRYQGTSFVDRFDANSYLLMTKLLDYFDPAAAHDGSLVEAFRRVRAHSVVLSFSSDWRFTTARSREVVKAMLEAKRNVSFAEIRSEFGHDSFLMPVPQYLKLFAAYMGEHRDVIGLERERVAAWVAEGARVLDLGCGDGSLLAHLRDRRGVHGYGIEIDPDNVVRCVARAVNVIQTDLDQGLAEFEDDSFDTVILLQTLQAVRYPRALLREMLRVGREGVVTFPNFGFWRARMQLTLGGRMPVTPGLPSAWYETENIHLCTLNDFESLCREERISVVERVVIGQGQHEGPLIRMWPQMFAEVAVYRVRRQPSSR